MSDLVKDTKKEDDGIAPTSTGAQKVVNLALQGGGSHGAFTWGVLDRLLEDERLIFEGITACSAGAVNAVVLANGLAAKGREGARAALRHFWKKMSCISVSGIFRPSLIDRANSTFGLDYSPGYVFMEALSYFLSPYQFNPFNYNPFKNLLEETIDFARIRTQRELKLFLSATNVETAKLTIFSGDDLRVEHLLASACLPLLMHAIEIDGEHYWDGGFMGNPAIYPLVWECETRDVILVHTTPLERRGVPKTSQAIMNRMQEISFNASHLREMRSFAYVTKLVDEGKADSKRIFVHAIDANDTIRNFSASSRVNGDWNFLLQLHELGRQTASEWLTNNFDQLGFQSTVDIQTRYL
jgi:NTE family protein